MAFAVRQLFIKGGEGKRSAIVRISLLNSELVPIPVEMASLTVRYSDPLCPTRLKMLPFCFFLLSLENIVYLLSCLFCFVWT